MDTTKPHHQPWALIFLRRLGVLNPTRAQKDELIAYYWEKYEEQNGQCAICGKHSTDCKRRLALDHNHKTGELRGLLCSGCNPNIAWLENRIAPIRVYLRHYQDPNTGRKIL